jgi:hypothetical protein
VRASGVKRGCPRRRAERHHDCRGDQRGAQLLPRAGRHRAAAPLRQHREAEQQERRRGRGDGGDGAEREDRHEAHCGGRPGRDRERVQELQRAIQLSFATCIARIIGCIIGCMVTIVPVNPVTRPRSPTPVARANNTTPDTAVMAWATPGPRRRASY